MAVYTDSYVYKLADAAAALCIICLVIARLREHQAYTAITAHLLPARSRVLFAIAYVRRGAELDKSQNPLDTFPRCFSVYGKVRNLLRTC